MRNDPHDVFREMDSMIERLLAGMGDDLVSDLPHTTGYRIVIEGGNRLNEYPEPEDYPGRDTSEPVAEVHRIGDDVHVVAGLPGISEENLSIRLNGHTLSIDAAGDMQTYHTTAEVPPVEPASLMHTLKNGVLEVTLKCQTGSSA